MNRFALFVLTLAFAAIFLAGSVAAQVAEQCPHLSPIAPRGERITNSPAVREQLIKLCIKEIKEDHDRLVERIDEISTLSSEINSSYTELNAFSEDDRERLDRLESLIKKVRKDLRASDDDEENKEPETVKEAVSLLYESTTVLADEIKKSSRHTISLTAVRSSNAVLRLIKFLRFDR